MLAKRLELVAPSPGIAAAGVAINHPRPVFFTLSGHTDRLSRYCSCPAPRLLAGDKIWRFSIVRFHIRP
jgi:hypothetical protein